MALAAVAQALNTLVNVMPVSPTRRVTASGLDTSWLPPKPNWMSFHSTPASVNANWMASAPICIAVLSNLPNGCRPTPMIATSLVIAMSLHGSVQSFTGWNANVMTSAPSSSVVNGTMVSSTSWPNCSLAGSFSVSRPSTRITASSPKPSWTRPTPNGTNSLPAGPAKGAPGPKP